MSTLKPLKRPRKAPVRHGPGASAGRPPLTAFYALLGAIAVVGIAVLAIRARNAPPLPPSDLPMSQVVRPLTVPTGQTAEGYWYKGDPDAPVTVIEYADFQCPACAMVWRQIEGGIDRDYVETGKVRFVFHDFPLSQHRNAVPAAEAARCADEGGQYWAMHDLLFARQREWANERDPTERFVAYAGDLDLDREVFRRCLASDRHLAAIRQAGAEATRAGIGSTPTFIVEGRPVDATGLRGAIDAALRAEGR